MMVVAVHKAQLSNTQFWYAQIQLKYGPMCNPHMEQSVTG